MFVLPVIVALLCVVNVSASAWGSHAQGKRLNFKTTRHMTRSTFWADIVRGRGLSPHSTSMYIAETQSIFLFPRNYREYSRWRFWRGPKIRLLEIQLVETTHKIINVPYYPLATFSAEWSTSGAVLEREVDTGYGVKYSLDEHFDQDIVAVGGSFGMVATRGRSSIEAESVVCRINAGGVGQLQVSSRLKYYPDAKFRQVVVDGFADLYEEKWENIHTALVGENHRGMVIYEDWHYNKHRCVTDRKYFEDPQVRRWIT